MMYAGQRPHACFTSVARCRRDMNLYLPVMNQFARAVWGNSDLREAVLKQHPGGFQFIDLGPCFAALRCWTAWHWENIFPCISSCYAPRPETGGCAAVPRCGWNFCALFKDTVKFHRLDNSEPLYQCPFVWALCDSNQYVTIPASVFQGKRDRVRVIQTTAPKSSRWKEWSKQVGAQPYIMDVCSDEEVAHLATLLELDVPRMIENWGNVPCLLVEYIDIEDSRLFTIKRPVTLSRIVKS
ncbi:hypothetical protein HD554DRAFT_395897 [Boletus coccyginus]|nr:hypothetical protein HD554DRAFT_395897 [Boletus coccyginus]